MKKIRFISTAFLAFAMVATSAQAYNGGDQGPSHTITWDEFKYRCSDARDKPLPLQGRPTNIRVQCTNIERDWVPGAPGSIPLDNSRHVVTTIVSDKFNVSPIGRDYPTGHKGGGQCLRYKEIERTIQGESILTCEQILGMKGDIEDFCATNLEKLKGTSPKLIETRETGAVRDTCGGGQQDGGKK